MSSRRPAICSCTTRVTGASSADVIISWPSRSTIEGSKGPSSIRVSDLAAALRNAARGFAALPDSRLLLRRGRVQGISVDAWRGGAPADTRRFPNAGRRCCARRARAACPLRRRASDTRCSPGALLDVPPARRFRNRRPLSLEDVGLRIGEVIRRAYDDRGDGPRCTRPISGTRTSRGFRSFRIRGLSAAALVSGARTGPDGAAAPERTAPEGNVTRLTSPWLLRRRGGAARLYCPGRGHAGGRMAESGRRTEIGRAEPTAGVKASPLRDPQPVPTPVSDTADCSTARPRDQRAGPAAERSAPGSQTTTAAGARRRATPRAATKPSDRRRSSSTARRCALRRFPGGEFRMGCTAAATPTATTTRSRSGECRLTRSRWERRK